MLRRNQSNAAEIETEEPAEAPVEVERSAPPRVERRKTERRGMDQLRSEALKAVISQVEDRNFGGLRNGRQGISWMSRIKPSRIALLLVALVAGGVAAYLSTQHEAPATVTTPVQQVVQEARTQILVARTAIGIGQKLTPDDMQWQDWPEGAVIPQYVSIAATPDGLAKTTGAVARFEIFPGEPIREDKLALPGSGYMSAVLDSGMLGVSVSVAAESASGGFIVPNDHVDVVLTRANDAGGQVSETIVRNVRVLAINARLGETGTTGAPANTGATAGADASASGGDASSTVFGDKAIATLELDPTQAQMVINGTSQGKLSLELRAMSDYGDKSAQSGAVNAAIRLSSPFWTESSKPQ
ncbi:MAG TPA: Flp pilus assembly protein CpaB [Devosia sp.]|nr:Flp pilus assembly protein CpaB [Devosia sp.]